MDGKMEKNGEEKKEILKRRLEEKKSKKRQGNGERKKKQTKVCMASLRGTLVGIPLCEWVQVG